MKNLIIILFLTAFTGFGFYAKGQNNLEFSRALMIEFDKESEYAFTVPEGKVWKIAKFFANGSLTLRHDNKDFYLSYQGSEPLWLPAGYKGTFIIPIRNTGYINIVEYTITTK